MRYLYGCTAVLALAACKGGESITPPPPPPPAALVVTITSPAASATLSDTAQVAYTVTGGTPPYATSVALDDGTGVTSQSPYPLITNPLKGGSHVVKVVATDAGSPKQTATATLTVTVANLLVPDSSFVTAPVSNVRVEFCSGPFWTTTGGTASIGLGQTQAKTRSGGGKTAQFCSGQARDSGYARIFVGNSITDRISTLAADSIRLAATATVTGNAAKTSDLTVYIQRFNGPQGTQFSVFASASYDNLQTSATTPLLPPPFRFAPPSGSAGYYLGLSFGLKWRCVASGVTVVSVSKLSLNFYYAGGTSAAFASEPFALTITCPSAGA